MAITRDIIRNVNSKISSRGIKHTRSNSSTGINIVVNRGNVSYSKVFSREEINEIYKGALKGHGSKKV
ncbi:hypothetical protein GCM10009118_07940 [Wandonia haliotis]|uniref:Uncharacterized protein n=1 Tax=Wandonia haliotis TaxID=574963 RepID=A0ABP3Y273_9FLAO